MHMHHHKRRNTNAPTPTHIHQCTNTKAQHQKRKPQSANTKAQAPTQKHQPNTNTYIFVIQTQINKVYAVTKVNTHTKHIHTDIMMIYKQMYTQGRPSPHETMMHFPPCFRFPPYFLKIFRPLRKIFTNFTFSRKIS